MDYGIKEVTFDEEHFFAFGEQLVRTPAFVAETATAWGSGYTWDEIVPMLDALLDEGILQSGEPSDDPRGGGLTASPLPPSVCPVPRLWMADFEGITRELGLRAVELGHLEAVVPVYRVAHTAIDRDDRQVGEANVYPPRLRVDRETEWRVCQYAGSRYRDDGPMNVTALRAMIKYWKPMMVTLMQIRRDLQARMLGARAQWTVGDLFVLACVVLALPAYRLGKAGAASPPLHPVLSSLFRITDGIRMVTYEMLFLLSETPRRPDEPMTAEAVYEYAEQHGLFITGTGVCAGPKPLIDEFLANAVDGIPIEGAAGIELDPELRDALAELPAAIDYGLLGVQIWAIGQATLVVMSHATEALLGILDDAAAHGPLGAAGDRLRDRLRVDWAELERQQITVAYDREIHMLAYADAYERSRAAARVPGGTPTLSEALAPRPEDASHRAAVTQVHAALAARLTDGALACADPLAEALVRYARDEQGLLASTAGLLATINQMLERPAAQRPLAVRDFFVYYAMRERAFVHLFDALADELGIWMECTADTIELTWRTSE